MMITGATENSRIITAIPDKSSSSATSTNKLPTGVSSASASRHTPRQTPRLVAVSAVATNRLGTSANPRAQRAAA
jgi:hypothetical protein